MTVTTWAVWAFLILGTITLAAWVASAPRPTRGGTHVTTTPGMPHGYIPPSGGLTPPRGAGAGSQGSTPTHCPGCICEITYPTYRTTTTP